MITDFIDHLTGELLVAGGYAWVAHAWDVEPNDDVTVADMPAALTFRASDNSQPSNADNRVRQRSDTEIFVYTVCRHDELDAMRKRLFDAALGWQAAPEYDALEHRRGEVRKLTGEYVWWLDVFATWRMNSET